MGGLMKGYADGLQESRIKWAESAAAQSAREAASATRRAEAAERWAAEAMQTARIKMAEAQGFEALFEVMYAAHVEPLLGGQKDDVQRSLSVKAKRWISENCTDEQRARIRAVWGSARMEQLNQKAGLVGLPKPAPVVDPPAPQKPPSDVAEIRIARWVFFTQPGWTFAGVDYKSKAKALQAQVQANERHAEEMRKWQEGAIRARNSYSAVLEKHEAWIKKFGPPL